MSRTLLNGSVRGRSVRSASGFQHQDHAVMTCRTASPRSGDRIRTTARIAATVWLLLIPTGQALAQSSGQPKGERLYVDQGCAVCHGLGGDGGVGPTLVGDKFLAMTDYVAAQILLGRGQMPGFASVLSNQEVSAVGSYVRESWGNHFGPVSPEDVQQAGSKTNAR
jgi:mono/diheme cytochrome c family protein